MNKCTLLKELLESPETLVMPDAFDPLSARIIEYIGFQAVQCSGYSFSISKCYSDEKEISLPENLAITKSIVAAVNVPVMADGEDGYGDGEVLVRNLKSFIETGIAGINIEDQNLRNNGNSPLIPESQMIDKIKTAIRVKKEMGCPDFILNARTDALTATDDKNEAIKIAVKRANLYLEAGADLCFVTKIKELHEVKILAGEIHGPISVAIGMNYNINNISINQCKELGIARVSLPSLAIFASLQALMETMKAIKETGEFNKIIDHDLLFMDFPVLKSLLSKE